MPVSLGELAVRFGCELRGDPDRCIERVATLANADERSLAFLANPRYRPQLAETHAAAVVLSGRDAAGCPASLLLCANPYATYARIATLLHPPPPLAPGVHATALIGAGARIDPSAEIGAYSSVAPGVSVGARAFVGPHCQLAAGVTLAEDVRLVARVTLGQGVQVGARSVLQPGVVIGADGFGFAPEKGTWLKVPQVGSVRLGADVEVGANTTIDRGAIEDTVIEEGVKLDNLIMIAHNVRIGAHTAIAACTGISGSTSIGRRCMIGGMVGFAGHLSIADDVVITAKSSVSHSIANAGVYSSTLPTEEAHAWRRLVARFKRSGLLEERLRRLERAAGIKGAPMEAPEEGHD
ncbi:MAG TPA: UDP-3-O-(3-hydroxymyristoyl)glucosamine N-acyltransferase [Steroidobacteraceae bacterium]|jgi:UDP-3-O-[3-hydroxymyristoyl] glucosamine N-acyltransferase|nr:UDP-3-O-(3-hydroxymyristoyl)glucosamine N-acyltransferase [Steroidobacteraceae bacterium]